MPIISALDHLVLTVRDLDSAVEFYTKVLGMQAYAFQGTDGTTRHALGFGVQKINLHQAGAEFAPHAKTPCVGSADLCFLSPTPLAEWAEHLATCGVEIIQGPIRRTGATGPILSIYIRDPDGALIEISNQIIG